jgi:hypothetical protein
MLLIAAAGITSCGRPPLPYGRPFPPDFDNSGYPRAMVVWAQGGNGGGTAQLIDVEHDTVNNKQDTIHSYTISGFSGTDPVSIQDFPGQQIAYVYSDGGTSAASSPVFQPINTGTDAGSTPTGGLSAGTTSVYVTQDFSYVYSVSPSATNASVGYLSVLRRADGTVTRIPLAGASKLSPSPGAVSGASSLLIFSPNANTGSNNVYQLVGIGQNSVFDCTQQILPISTGGGSLPFDKPINALYSSDGTSAFILNCGPECGGTTASVSIVSTTALAAGAQAAYQATTGCNIESSYTPAPLTVPVQNIPIPGGVTVALQNGNTLFLAGQQFLSDGHLGGFVTAVNLSTLATTSTPIGDGTHFRMRLGDNNTLWIAAKGCTEGEQAAKGGQLGCMTMVPLIANSDGTFSISASSTSTAVPACPSAAVTSTSGLVTCVEPNQGDAKGLAPIIGYDKIYTIEGGEIYIYSTVDGSPISNVNVQVPGQAHDIAFIDGGTDTQP